MATGTVERGEKKRREEEGRGGKARGKRRGGDESWRERSSSCGDIRQDRHVVEPTGSSVDRRNRITERWRGGGGRAREGSEGEIREEEREIVEEGERMVREKGEGERIEGAKKMRNSNRAIGKGGGERKNIDPVREKEEEEIGRASCRERV